MLIFDLIILNFLSKIIKKKFPSHLVINALNFVGKDSLITGSIATNIANQGVLKLRLMKIFCSILK